MTARHRNCSDNDTMKKMLKRRGHQNGNAPPPRANRRVSKSTSLNFQPIGKKLKDFIGFLITYFICYCTQKDSDMNSSSDDESPPRNVNDGPAAIPEDSDETDDNHNDISQPSTSSRMPVNLAVPSTSTGITDNGKKQSLRKSIKTFF